jgi:hypothetical protein
MDGEIIKKALKISKEEFKEGDLKFPLSNWSLEDLFVKIIDKFIY